MRMDLPAKWYKSGTWTVGFCYLTAPSFLPSKLKEIDNAPTIDAVPVVRGEWIENPTKDSVLCSYCYADWNLFDNDTYRFCYCPNCGAKMEVEP